MIRSALRTLAASFVQDPNITRYTTTRYNDALDKANVQFALDTKALWKDTSYTTTADDSTYDLPTDFMWEESVSYDGISLKPISRHTLAINSPGNDWTDDEGTPTNYMIDPEEAVKTLRLYPIPQEAKTVVLRYFPLPAAMTADTDVPLNSSALMAQFHMGLAAFAAWLLLLSEQSTPQIVDKRNELLRIYTDSVTKAVDTFKNTASEPLRIRPIR